MRVLLLGAPGSGKGTQGPRLARLLGVPHVAVGDLLRTEAASGSALGARLGEVMARGELVSDELTTPLVTGALRASLSGFVLDGYPRTRVQADALDAFLGRRAAPLDAVLRFRIPSEVVTERLLARGRVDDTSETVRARLATWAAHEDALIEHYRGLVVELDALGAPDEVFDRAADALREHATVAA
ncbi:nucleoside monophosphate kinase [Schumannella sp. 10F1B-5-1]|uniref:adenylate kinase family protein n=1 Tax=Schumannella sp. 10F1B-5-1 TaxID=2590780 RepID=UPI00210673CE|nr:nucleoside monophosphate kinase [Schumannella sp. 10F1B-5-1]